MLQSDRVGRGNTDFLKILIKTPKKKLAVPSDGVRPGRTGKASLESTRKAPHHVVELTCVLGLTYDDFVESIRQRIVTEFQEIPHGSIEFDSDEIRISVLR